MFVWGRIDAARKREAEPLKADVASQNAVDTLTLFVKRGSSSIV